MLVQNKPLEGCAPRLWNVSVCLAALILIAAAAALSLAPRAVAEEKPGKPGESAGATGILPVPERTTGETPVPPAAKPAGEKSPPSKAAGGALIFFDLLTARSAASLRLNLGSPIQSQRSWNCKTRSSAKNST
jgi:hypothetical protein